MACGRAGEFYIKKLVKQLRVKTGLEEDDEVESLRAGRYRSMIIVGLQKYSSPTPKATGIFIMPRWKGKGYTEFKGQWGNRPNVDNWQRLAAIPRCTAAQCQIDDFKGLDAHPPPAPSPFLAHRLQSGTSLLLRGRRPSRSARLPSAWSAGAASAADLRIGLAPTSRRWTRNAFLPVPTMPSRCMCSSHRCSWTRTRTLYPEPGAVTWKPLDPTWEIKLRPNVKWRGGCSGASVEGLARTAKSSSTVRTFAAIPSRSRIDTPDALTVQLTMNVPNYANLANDLNSVPIMPKAVAAAARTPSSMPAS